MAGITRVHGTAAAGGFYGYQPLILKIAGTGVGNAGIDGNFEVVVKAIQQRASIVFIGTRANNQFCVIVDAATANAYVSANDDTDIVAAIDAVVTAALAEQSISVTVTDISGLVAGNLA
jgi:hypothetical protein